MKHLVRPGEPDGHRSEVGFRLRRHAIAAGGVDEEVEDRLGAGRGAGEQEAAAAQAG